ncbi:MAG: tRNA 2-selenouridine synthase, partial [Candidatus Cloacimonetes bacterium]|nr:tRNA 2-selenouridine synthase [Candidatus Cloacimonadota bacterium]
MTKTIDIEHFFKLRDELPVMDVRSPSEFAKGHIPKAVNIPLFSDEERADVG